MPPSIQKVLADAIDGKHSLVNCLSENDVLNVWEKICAYIEKQMSSQKGVKIPKFGTFSFSQRRLDVGNNRSITMQRPVFNISEKFANAYGLQFTKYIVPGTIPTVPLNYAVLSMESPFDRNIVEGCVHEIITSVARAVISQKNVELVFSGIGRLQIRNTRAKLKFYKDFIKQMDGTGELLDSMRNRAETLDSVMSNRPLSRTNSRDTVILPKFQFGSQSTATLHRVTETEEVSTHAQDTVELVAEGDEDKDNALCDVDSHNGERLVPRPGHDCNTSCLDHGQDDVARDIDMAGNRDCQSIAISDVFDGHLRTCRNDGKAYSKPSKRSLSRTLMPVAKADAVFIADDLNRRTDDVAFSQAPPSVPRSVNSVASSRKCVNGLKPPSPPPADQLHRRDGSKVANEDDARPGTACGHHNAGQELCYLCHQRARRNVPVSLAEERKRKDGEENELLLQYQALKDAEDLLHEQRRHIARRCDLQKMSAFNLGVTEAIHMRRRERDKCGHGSYIFQRRPVTPPKFSRQVEYLTELSKQVESQSATLAKMRTDTRLLERMEQTQLSEDLAAERKRNIKDKEVEVTTYRSALDAQLKFKPDPLPRHEADAEIFGRNDMTNERLVERRQRAQHLYQDQYDLVEWKRQAAASDQQAERQRAEQLLNRAHESVAQERRRRHLTRYENRRQLEDNWRGAVEAKHGRELEERLAGLETGQLLHEQCDKYGHCRQCKRRVTNCGESNIWRDSYYMPGTRIMV